MKQICIIVFFNIVLAFSCFAQKPQSIRINITTSYDSVLYDLSYYQKQHIVQLKTDSILLMCKIDSLRRVVELRDKTIGELSAQNTQLRRQLSEANVIIKANDEKIKELQEKVKTLGDSADVLYLEKLINCLYLNYSPGVTKAGLNAFNKIKNEEMKSKNEKIYSLVENYELYYNTFLDILKEAQNDGERDHLGLTAKAETFADKYLLKIKNMSYYHKGYTKDKKKISIKFLDQKITKAIDLLELHKKKQMVDFSGLIKEMEIQF